MRQIIIDNKVGASITLPANQLFSIQPLGDDNVELILVPMTAKVSDTVQIPTETRTTTGTILDAVTEINYDIANIKLDSDIAITETSDGTYTNAKHAHTRQVAASRLQRVMNNYPDVMSSGFVKLTDAVRDSEEYAMDRISLKQETETFDRICILLNGVQSRVTADHGVNIQNLRALIAKGIGRPVSYGILILAALYRGADRPLAGTFKVTNRPITLAGTKFSIDKDSLVQYFTNDDVNAQQIVNFLRS